MSFQGEYINSVDVKGRASIPARFRELLDSVHGDDRLVVTKRNGGLLAYPTSEWDKIKQNIEAMPPGTTREDILRVLVAPAVECGFDKQGRIQIPQSLRSYADIEKDIVVVGLFSKIEIWSQRRHAEVTSQSEARLDQAGDVLAEIGF
ncbi:MAG: division/cell wall cluster transcriptional repressor MraZ [Desulfuromonadales bacterium]